LHSSQRLLASQEAPMTSRLQTPTRRSFIASSALAASMIAAAPLPFSNSALAQSGDPLPSWNDGPAKDAILKFVRATTEASSPDFVPPEERIATFDQDGTLWVEQLIYTQVICCLDRVPTVAKEKLALADVEPFKTVLLGNREAIAKFSLDDFVKIAAATLTGMASRISRPRRKTGCSRRRTRAGSGPIPI
jgi:hypothetical protein